ncbi:MAG: bifunctional [glutamate--ammonia ligase]-adenylyl-L-tyrosine phosphorylase/[glutamate--ammonia-ligase] adenylyltransferase, partial [Pseudomonadota bacterium]
MSLSNPRQALALSPFLEQLDARHPSWLPELLEKGRLDANRPPDAATLADSIQRHGLDPGLRRFRNREMLRLTWREITGTAPLTETLHDLSRLAELCLEAAIEAHKAPLIERFGTPRNREGEPQSLVVLGLGKLGGGELNLSSDIDLILCFTEPGSCDGRRGLANEQFFTRLARAVIGSLTERTEDGFCFRVDTRLRPFGEAGPLVCSFGALEQYYQREGRDWERYALIKARPVAGNRTAGNQLLSRLSPFVYRRYIDFGAVEALRDMLDGIRADAARKDRGEDVKRGPGGIREVEFLVQCAQLLRGGREPTLQTASLLAALAALERRGLFPAARIKTLRDAYEWLRRLENAIQAQHDQQTHSLPEGEDLERIVRIMGEAGEQALRASLATVRDHVTEALEDSFPRQAEEVHSSDPADQWASRLSGARADSWSAFLERIQRYALTGHARQRLDDFMDLLLQRLDHHAIEADAIADVQRLVLAICRRSAYLALLVQNPAALDRMLELFEESDWIAETVIRHPSLLDELIDPALGRTLPDRDELVRSAERLSGRAGQEEQAIDNLNYLKRAQSLRIAVAELEGVITSVEAERRLTVLAEVLVTRCTALATSMIEKRHGRPEGFSLAIIGYGSLGAGDMGYGSDLDLVFLYPGHQGPSNGDRPLPPETWYTRLVRRLLALVTTVSPSGRLYEVDTRLRPNGRSGLLVSSFSAFERYQKEKAWVWEWQALTRARAVAGGPELVDRFAQIREAVLATPRDPELLRAEIPAMRARMREGLHLLERNQLMFIIALGESMLLLGATMVGAELTGPLFLTA